MQPIHSTSTRSIRSLHHDPLVCFEGERRFARQVDAARRLAPAEAYRGHAALLLSCGEPDAEVPAERALRELRTLDAVHSLRCPIQSWNEVLETAPGATSWLEHYVMREIRRQDPILLAILVPGSSPQSEDRSALEALVSTLRGWGASPPIAALRIHSNEEVEWLVAPAGFLEATG